MPGLPTGIHASCLFQFDDEASVSEPDLFLIAASPGMEQELSAEESPLDESYDLDASGQPLTQDLFPEVLLDELNASSPIASSFQVSLQCQFRFCLTVSLRIFCLLVGLAGVLICVLLFVFCPRVQTAI